VLPAILNAANEVAVQAFLDDRISFPEIWRLVQNAMGSHSHLASPTLDDILRADKEARDFVQRALL
jgi:1-deoxy-D-xylulose-5-phosphate reductoisomerase